MTLTVILAAAATYATLMFVLTVITSPLLAASSYFVAKKYDIKSRNLCLIPFVTHPFLGVLTGKRVFTLLLFAAEVALIICGFLPQRPLFFTAWILFSVSLSTAVWNIAYLRKYQAVIVFFVPCAIPLILLTLLKKEI